MTELKTKNEGWINAYYENKLDNLPLGYIKKVESLAKKESKKHGYKNGKE